MPMNDFSSDIEKEIEARGMTPRPRWHFLLKRSVFWSLAVASILIGAAAFSVADYVFFDNEGISTATLLESPLEWIINSIPFIWVFVYGLFGVVTYIGLRHTRSGYKYRTAGIILGVLVVTIGLGLILNKFDFGQGIHYYLLNHTSFYDALIYSNDDVR
ncbi:hypothetical protein BH11PAT2_BH11PAT2_04040 [soil metagenome]